MPENPYKRDPYLKAAFVPKLHTNGVMIVSDFDGTQTTGAELPSDRELSDRKAVLEIAERTGGVTVGVSARSHGLMMCQKTYEASVENGFSEAPPHWRRNPDTGKYEFVDLAEVPFFKHNLNWDIAASFGGGILVMNGHGYLVDTVYENHHLKFDWIGDLEKTDADPELLPWRHAALAFLSSRFQKGKDFMPNIEFYVKYMHGEANVAPLPYRIQYNFPGKEGYDAMMELRDIIRRERHAGDPLAMRLQLVDESRLDPDPEKCVYVMYLVPWYGRKENMINRFLHQSARAAERPVDSVRMFYAGDTLTDLRAGLYSGREAPTTFLLATGSRLAPYFIERRDRYGAEDLSFLWANPTKGRHEPRLMPTKEKGVYTMTRRFPIKRTNTIVIGDERYPGATPPGSVAQFLDEFLVNGRASQ